MDELTASKDLEVLECWKFWKFWKFRHKDKLHEEDTIWVIFSVKSRIKCSLRGRKAFIARRFSPRREKESEQAEVENE